MENLSAAGAQSDGQAKSWPAKPTRSLRRNPTSTSTLRPPRCSAYGTTFYPFLRPSLRSLLEKPHYELPS
jgi:hypothetical protein